MMSPHTFKDAIRVHYLFACCANFATHQIHIWEAGHPCICLGISNSLILNPQRLATIDLHTSQRNRGARDSCYGRAMILGESAAIDLDQSSEK